MATFAKGTEDGEAVHVEMAPRRHLTFRLDSEAMRLTRARTFALYQAQDIHVDDIAAVFNVKKSFVYRELAWLADRAAQGKSNRVRFDCPADGPQEPDD